MVEYTGERFIPGIHNDKETEIEHLQRYYSIKNIIQDRVVVDAACGEGYGSMFMAGNALKVIGIDISEESIKRAKEKYKKDNLDFICASISKIPVEDKTADIIVSFETIEHVDPQTQNDFMLEAQRMLKEDGLLIISTPNREIYTELFDYRNQFHVKEFSRSEFHQFLSNYFKYIKMFRQGFEVVSLLNNGKENSVEVLDINENSDNAKYMIAICSNRKINVSISSIVYDDQYLKLKKRIIETQDEIEKLSVWGKRQDEEIAGRDKTILSLNKRIEELSSWGIRLDEENRRKDDAISLLNEQIGGYMAELDNLREVIYINYDILKQQEARIQEQEARIQEQEEELKKIYCSRGWRLLLVLYKIENWIMPLHSRRREALKTIYFLLKNIKLVIRHINMENLKKLCNYARKESPGRVFGRIKSYFNRFKPIPKMELEIFERANTYEKISFKISTKPMVSIIIPVYNKWEYTYSCLRSILENTESIEYEVIVADDMSNDDTVNIGQYIENIKVIRSTENLGFLRNCNNAAKHAAGKYILFLNNDTNVQKGWLMHLVELAEKDDTIGLVGSKLVFGDGRLQEAGGIIWRDASGWNYGRFDDPEKPEYNYVKEVDYISGACIMIRSELWVKIGGFDERYAPAYYEDSDLAFEVRKHGYKVVYQPKSVIVHFEGISHGQNENEGLKSYQVKNQQKFFDKWKEILGREHFQNGEDVFLARDRSASKKRILVIDHYVPHYDKDAGGKCTYMYLNLFLKLGLRVTFIGDNFYPHEPYTTELEQMGIEVLYGNYYYENWQKWIKTNGHYFDYVYLNRPHISIKYIDLVRSNSDARIIYFGHDLHYLRELREYEITGNAKLLASSEEWKKEEYELFKKADVIHVVGAYEQSILMKEFPNKPIRNIPVYFYNDNEIKSKEPIQFSKRENIMFVGGFGHSPNTDAVLWFAKEVYPKVLKIYPHMKWYVIGSNPPKEVLDLASDNVIITGFVSDEKLEEYYNTCRMSVVPLRYGAGVKGKVIESVYHRLPMITTSIGAEGLSTEEKAFIIADTAEDFACQIIHSYNDFKKLEELSQNCIAFIENNFTERKAEEIIKMDVN